jgi:ribosomal protein S18 acetylase RimI-like enzyme
VIVRAATQEDYPALADLWFDSWMSIGIANDTDLPREGVRARFYEEVKSRWRLLVAEENGILSGLLALVQSESRIDQIFVAPAAKGTGVGRLLLDFAKSEFPEGIVLVTHSANSRARAFYERHGFVLERTEDDPAHRREKCHYSWRPRP